MGNSEMTSQVTNNEQEAAEEEVSRFQISDNSASVPAEVQAKIKADAEAREAAEVFKDFAATVSKLELGQGFTITGKTVQEVITDLGKAKRQYGIRKRKHTTRTRKGNVVVTRIA